MRSLFSLRSSSTTVGEGAARSRFGLNTLRLTGSSAAGQAILLASTPLLTRLYGAEDFGALALFSATYAFLVAVVTLKYDLSIILPRRHDRAVALTALTLLAAVALSSVLALGLTAGWLRLGVPGYLLLLPVATVLGAGYTCARQWAARASDYRRFSRSQVVSSLANAATAILFAALAGAFLGGLVLGFVAGLATGLLYMAVDDLRRRARGLPALARIASLARAYRRFPAFVLPSTLLTILGTTLTPILLQALFSLKDLGYYAVANRLLLAPTALVGGAVAEAFRAEFVERQRRGAPTAPFFAGTLRQLVLFGLPVFALLFVAAPPLFALLLGAEYRESGILARYLCVGAFALFVAPPFHYVFVATDHVRLGLVAQGIAALLPIAGLVAGAQSGRLEIAVLSAAILTFLSSAVLVALARRCARRRDEDAPTAERRPATPPVQ